MIVNLANSKGLRYFIIILVILVLSIMGCNNLAPDHLEIAQNFDWNNHNYSNDGEVIPLFRWYPLDGQWEKIPPHHDLYMQVLSGENCEIRLKFFKITQPEMGQILIGNSELVLVIDGAEIRLHSSAYSMPAVLRGFCFETVLFDFPKEHSKKFQNASEIRGRLAGLGDFVLTKENIVKINNEINNNKGFIPP